VHVRAGRQQCSGDLGVAGERGLVQRAAALSIARIDLGLVLEQQLDAGRIVFFRRGGRQQHRLSALRIRPRAALEEELGQPPVACHAGHAQRCETVVVQRIQFRRRVAQQRHHAGVGAAGGMVQRRVAVGIGNARIGTVGQQRGDRIGPAMPAVAGCREQWGDAGMRMIEVDAVRDQRAQQTQVGQHGRQRAEAALVARALRRQCMRVRAGVDEFQCAIDASGAGCVEQRLVQVQILRGVFACRRNNRHLAVVAIRHLNHRQHARAIETLHAPVQQRQQQRIRHRGTRAHCLGHQAVPGQAETATYREREQGRHGQTTPGVEIALHQAPPVRGQGAAIPFQPMPERPGAP
jgi:hypothetical protein